MRHEKAGGAECLQPRFDAWGWDPVNLSGAVRVFFLREPRFMH